MREITDRRRSWLTYIAENYSVTESLESPKQAYPNVTVYLPPGPVFQQQNTPTSTDVKNSVSHNDTDPFRAQHDLAISTSSTVVTIHYRLGTIEPPEEQLLDAEPPENDGSSTAKSDVAKPDENEEPRLVHYEYQNAVHDTLTAFDWIQKTFQSSQLDVLGSHVGGSLALMLALTESQSIHAVAAVEPICDWTGLDEWCMVPDYLPAETDPQVEAIKEHISNLRLSEDGRGAIKGKTKSQSVAPPELVPLLEARKSLFVKPEQYFDPFASPILFVRTPGRAIPAKFPLYLTGPDHPIPVLREKIVLDVMSLGLVEDEDVLRGETLEEEIDDEHFNNYYDESIYIVADQNGRRYNLEIPIYRKALLRWPPKNLDYGLSGVNWFQPHLLVFKRLDVTLPWVHLFVRQPESRKSGNKTILSQQAKYMHKTLQRACFWGGSTKKEVREKGVQLSRVPSGEIWPASDSIEKTAGEWLNSVMERPRNPEKEKEETSEESSG